MAYDAHAGRQRREGHPRRARSRVRRTTESSGRRSRMSPGPAARDDEGQDRECQRQGVENEVLVSTLRGEVRERAEHASGSDDPRTEPVGACETPTAPEESGAAEDDDRGCGPDEYGDGAADPLGARELGARTTPRGVAP